MRFQRHNSSSRGFLAQLIRCLSLGKTILKALLGTHNHVVHQDVVTAWTMEF